MSTEPELPALRCHRCWLRHHEVKQIPSEEGDRFVCINRQACKWREKIRKMKRGKK